MKIGTVTKANKKGQLVIPKEIRDELNIKQGTPLNIVQRGEGVYIYPISAVVTKAEEEKSYLEILRKTGCLGRQQLGHFKR